MRRTDGGRSAGTVLDEDLFLMICILSLLSKLPIKKREHKGLRWKPMYAYLLIEIVEAIPKISWKQKRTLDG